MKKENECPGITYFVDRTMFGDEVRECATCHAKHVIFKPPVLPLGSYGKLVPELYICSKLGKPIKK